MELKANRLNSFIIEDGDVWISIRFQGTVRIATVDFIVPVEHSAMPILTRRLIWGKAASMRVRHIFCEPWPFRLGQLYSVGAWLRRLLCPAIAG